MTLLKTNNGLKTRSLFPVTTFFDDFFASRWSELDLSAEKSTDWIPAANVKEDDEQYIVELSVPGYNKKDIRVEVDANNILQITGEREEKTSERKDNYTRKEFSYGSFARSFQLPEVVNEGEISANYSEGVLAIALPKKEISVINKTSKEVKVN